MFFLKCDQTTHDHTNDMQPSQISDQETLQSNWLLKTYFKEQNKLKVQVSLTKKKKKKGKVMSIPVLFFVPFQKYE